MNIPDELVEMVNADIKRIDAALNDVEYDDYWGLFNEMNGKYHACIKGFYMCMCGANLDGTHLLSISQNDTRSLKHNLEMIKANLETYKFGVNAIETPIPSTNVNVTTNVNLNLTFEEARSAVEDMTALTDDQTQEILSRIDEIEQTIKGSGSKKSKWEKTKPILEWLAKQSLDIGKIILPLLLNL